MMIGSESVEVLSRRVKIKYIALEYAISYSTKQNSSIFFKITFAEKKPKNNPYYSRISLSSFMISLNSFRT